MNGVEEERLDQLRLGKRRADLQERLAREKRRALRHCPDVAGEAQTREPVQETRRESVKSLKLVDRRFGEGKPLEVVEYVVEAAGEEEVPRFGQPADEQAEDGSPLKALLEVRAQHRELVEVREEGCGFVADPMHLVHLPAP